MLPLHQILKLERTLFWLDTETTGLSRENARIIELGFQEWNPEGLKREWVTRLNPGVPISPEVTEITGITDFDVSARPYFKQIAENLARGFSDCDFGGKNVRFDLRVISSEMERAGVSWSYAGARIIDNDRLESVAVPRNLSAMYERYTGKKLEGAHGALADVRASLEVAATQLLHWEILPRTLDELHALQWPDWIDTEGKFRFNSHGVAIMRFGKYEGEPMSKVPADYWNFILSPKEKFSAETKRYAADAKLGKFPSRPPKEVPIETGELNLP